MAKITNHAYQKVKMNPNKLCSIFLDTFDVRNNQRKKKSFSYNWVTDTPRQLRKNTG